MLITYDMSSGTTLKDRFSTLCCAEKYADVHFIVGQTGNKQRIPAHKNVLSVGSVVFHTMFYGEMELSNNIKTDEVPLPDIEPDGFKALLRFLYTDDVSLNMETVITTLYAAKKYDVQDLVKACTGYLAKNIKPQNAFLLLGQSELFGEKELSNQCLELIDRNTKAALDIDSFTSITYETLCTLLKRPTFKAPGLQVFRACCKWAEQECNRIGLPITQSNQREVLNEALDFIDFESIPLDEFSQHVSTTGILTDGQIIQLFQRLTIKEKERQTKEKERLVRQTKEKERLENEAKEFEGAYKTPLLFVRARKDHN